MFLRPSIRSIVFDCESDNKYVSGIIADVKLVYCNFQIACNLRNASFKNKQGVLSLLSRYNSSSIFLELYVHLNISRNLNVGVNVLWLPGLPNCHALNPKRTQTRTSLNQSLILEFLKSNPCQEYGESITMVIAPADEAENRQADFPKIRGWDYQMCKKDSFFYNKGRDYD